VAEHVEFRPMKKQTEGNPEDVESGAGEEAAQPLGPPSEGDAQTIDSVEELSVI
jgi:hypothetical protein